jgi:hypothetical protein
MAISKLKPTMPTSGEAVEAVNQILQERGMLVKRKAVSGRPVKGEPVPGFQPIPARGKPVSEIIIEGRG